ncbi:MAG: recombinase family protein [Selenomonadaceae bacterium]|nr:recombinase family protein [Selenomonadaceae bacterium]
MADQRIAIYIRLSQADEDTGKGKRESNSVMNQRSLIHHFLDAHEELSAYPRMEFVDDGYTGTNTNRPAFQRMIAAIKEGRYSCCITKDFSRFARDYIEMGDYLEYLFPFLRVRYISINDGYDSQDYRGTTGGLDVVMRAIIYDAYSKDLSVKSKTSRQQAMKKGRRVTGDPGYGYMRDPNRTAMDIIDPETAPIVRRIFEDAMDGVPVGEIAAMLNREGILPPGTYFRKRNPQSRKYASSSEKIVWTHDSVSGIIKRYAYTGAFVGGMRELAAPCKVATVRKSREDWIIVPGMHEAIITPEEYALAQKIFKGRARQKTEVKVYPLKSLLVCGNCLCHMVLNKGTAKFYCQYRPNGGDKQCRETNTPKQTKMEEIIFHAIQDYMRLAEDGLKKRKSQLRDLRRAADSSQDSIRKLEQSVASLKQKKFREYDRYCSGSASKEAYLGTKLEMDAQIARLESEITALKGQDNPCQADEQGVYSELEAVCEAFRDEESLTYDMAHAFVDRILVYPDERIEIQWRFRDCFTENEVF